MIRINLAGGFKATFAAIIFLTFTLFSQMSSCQNLSVSASETILAEAYPNYYEVAGPGIGLFNSSAGASGIYNGSTCFASQNMNIASSTSTLTVTGSGSTVSSYGCPGGPIYGESVLYIQFSVNSPFNYTTEINYSQSAMALNAFEGYLSAANAATDIYEVSLNNGGIDFYGSPAGILQAGLYTFDVDLQDLGGGCGSQDSGQFNVVLILSPFHITTTTISGYITDACSGLPITSATVEIGALSVSTDAQGYYTQSNLPPATYTVIASAPNYTSATNSVTTTSSQTNVTDNFTLSSLGRLDYFGIGVNWATVTPPGSVGLRGDNCAASLNNTLQSDLSSTFNPSASITVSLDASRSSIDNLSTVTTVFDEFKNVVCPNDIVVFYVNSHAGNDGVFGIQISLASDYGNNPVFAGPEIAELLNLLPASSKKVVILDCCHGGGIANYLVGAAPNTSALAASAGTLEYIGNIVYGGETVYYNDGTSVFTDGLITCLNNGVFNLNQIAADIYGDAFGMYVSVIGQSLNLQDTGSAVFTGLQPQLWESTGFSGNLGSNAVAGLAFPPSMSHPTIANQVFQTTLTNMPTNGAVAIELSTNLSSWLQVGFDEVAGSNILFTFPMTNYPTAFFRTKVVP